MDRWTRRVFGIAAAAAVAGCGMIADAPAEPPPVTEEVFIEVYVELRAAATRTTSREDFEARRQEILDAHDVTRADLEAFLEANQHDLAYLASVWTEIERRLRELSQLPF